MRPIRCNPSAVGLPTRTPCSRGPETKISARVNRTTNELEQNIAIAGCDPALALLQGNVPGLAGRCFWVNCGSARALELLAGGWVHAAGLHYSGADGKENLRHIERFDAAGRWQVLRFTRWEQGWMLRPGIQKNFTMPQTSSSRDDSVGQPGTRFRQPALARRPNCRNRCIADKRIRGYTKNTCEPLGMR
jgi:hypothetical protein